MKANLPAALCLAALLYCCWELDRSRKEPRDPDSGYKVVITVHGPNGTIIPIAGPAEPAHP